MGIADDSQAAHHGIAASPGASRGGLRGRPALAADRRLSVECPAMAKREDSESRRSHSAKPAKRGRAQRQRAVQKSSVRASVTAMKSAGRSQRQPADGLRPPPAPIIPRRRALWPGPPSNALACVLMHLAPGSEERAIPVRDLVGLLDAERPRSSQSGPPGILCRPNSRAQEGGPTWRRSCPPTVPAATATPARPRRRARSTAR